MLSRVYLVRFTRFGCAAAIRQAAACVRFAKPFIQREVHRWPCGPSKEKFYSKEELEADQKADAEKAEREERLRREQEHQKKCERLEQTYDGTMSSLKEFTKSFYYDRDVKEALDMVYEKLREQPAGCAAAFAADELEQFFKLCGDLARYNPGDEQKILNMARTMMGGLAA